MKKMNLIFSSFVLCGALVACNSSSDNGTSSTGDSSRMTTTSTTATTPDSNSTMNNNTTTAMSKTPLDAKDSTFVMKAAVGGMEEVNGGKVAQSNAASDRVKAFGAMMVADHSKANSELMSLASSKGMTLPSALPADKQMHIDAMNKMKGKDFDSHYMSMMVNDHKTDIAEFEKAASGATDPDLKAWAAKTLPTLKMHLDSAQAINKAHM